MIQRKPDDRLMETFVGNHTSEALSEQKVQLALLQSASLLALEGTTRATASQIAAKASQEYGIEVTASFTGQTLSYLNIGSVTTHGKNKFVLDADQLEKIRKGITDNCEKSLAKLQTSIEIFQDLPQRIEKLQAEWKETLKQRAKEQELIRLINADRQNPPRLDYLQAEYQKIQKRNEYINAVKQEAKSLEQKEKKLPSLEERKKAIEIRIAEHEQKVRALIEKERQIVAKEEESARKETSLAGRLEKLQKRLGWLDLASLNEAIENSRKELDSLSKQLGEKRSLLDKILQRNKGGQG
jgi:DNA repair exonuclease SbcCD ATPase subunit